LALGKAVKAEEHKLDGNARESGQVGSVEVAGQRLVCEQAHLVVRPEAESAVHDIRLVGRGL